MKPKNVTPYILPHLSFAKQNGTDGVMESFGARQHCLSHGPGRQKQCQTECRNRCHKESGKKCQKKC